MIGLMFLLLHLSGQPQTCDGSCNCRDKQGNCYVITETAQAQFTSTGQPSGKHHWTAIRATKTHECEIWQGKSWIAIEAPMGALQCYEDAAHIEVIGGEPDDSVQPNPFDAAAKRAADETDAYGGLLTDEQRAWSRSLELKATPRLLKDGDITDFPPEPSAEPIDVPAMPKGMHYGSDSCGNSVCFDHWVQDYKCEDTSRILLTSEDGRHWCHKVQP
jgi:hypothetical protein